MDLNESYGNVRNYILLMEPLFSINKAYSMVLKVEKEMEVHCANDFNASTMIVKGLK